MDKAAPPNTPPQLPSSAQGNLDALRQFQDASETDVSRMQLAIERASRFFGSPAYFVFVVVFAVAWIAFNTWAFQAQWRHADEPPFFWLQGLVSFNALILTVAVLIRQNRMSHLASHRAHLDLQINLVTEQKVSKLLELVEEMRSGRTATAPESDDEVEQLTQPTDPKAMLAAIQRSDKGA